MKNSMLLLVGMFVGLQAFAQETPCKAKVTPYIDQWDDRTINAVISGISQVKTQYVRVGMAFFRSGSKNIKIEIELKETNYAWTQAGGHQVQVQATVFPKDHRDQAVQFSDVGQSYQSRELAVSAVVQKAVESADLDSMAQKMGCSKI